MKTRTLAILGAFIAAAAAGIAPGVRAQQATADLVLTNGKIITVDNKFAIAQAVAIRGDRFVAVGTNQDVTRLAEQGTGGVAAGGRAGRSDQTVSRRQLRRRRDVRREHRVERQHAATSYFVMRENDLGSIQPGKLADLVVMDRDYLTIPAD